MNPSEAHVSTKLKVGSFTALGVLLIGAITVVVNDKPNWLNRCQLVHINVEDATGLKTKSPVRSLGLEIGYIKSVILSDTHVDLGICVTEQVEVLPTTRAYIRGEGFLGDKFVELKPVRYVGPGAKSNDDENAPVVPPSSNPSRQSHQEKVLIPEAAQNFHALWNFLIPSAQAEEVRPKTATEATPNKKTTRQIPVGEGTQDIQNLVKRVDSLVGEMTNLTTHLKQAINPEELRATMRQLSRTLESASRTLAPESGLNQTAQRALGKLEDAIEQMRAMATRVNQGQGSVGMLLNDPTYAEELRELVRSAKQLLSKVGGVRFVPDLGGEKILGYDAGRGWFRLGIWPKKDRYYLLGISLDPRGGQTLMKTTTSVANGPSVSYDTDQVEKTRLLLTGMLGKVFFERLDLSLGALHGDGAVSIGAFLGPQGSEERFQFRTDIYSHGSAANVDARLSLIAKFYEGAYVRIGLESFRKVNDALPVSYGAGVSFDDEDIKLLFALR